MPAPRTTLLIEGTFKELVEELADYVDNLSKGDGSLKAAVAPLLENYARAEEAQDEDAVDAARDAVLEKVVGASSALNAAPEKDFTAAYNLLIHLIVLSSNTNMFLRPICANLTGDVAASRFGLVLSILTTIFNVIPQDESIRYPVFSSILDIISRNTAYEVLKNQINDLDQWLVQWQTPPAQQRKLYVKIAGVAEQSGEDGEAYDYIVKALRTFPNSDAAGDDARKLSVDALRRALVNPTHFDFDDLTALDSIQALRNSEAVYYQLLEVVSSEQLDDYIDFKDEHKGWIDEQKLDDDVLTRKMRLLTLASLAASSGQTRSIPYASIARSLQIPSEEVELWVIDVIRAGLVEGKLSQLNQTFLIHRSTYRVFGENQWREVAGRLEMWRGSLRGVLSVIRQEKENLVAQKEAEQKVADGRINGASGDQRGGYRGRNRRDQNYHHHNQHADAIDIGMD